MSEPPDQPETPGPAAADAETAPASSRGSAPARGPLLDPGWLFLISGLVILAATVLIPAKNDLDEARFYLDRALAVEKHRLDRIERYVGYLDALDKGDEGTILALAAMQVNKTPDGNVLLMSEEPSRRSASVFSQLEPPPMVLPERRVERSRLETWCLSDTPRLIMTAAGAMCVLIGLLPPTLRKP